MGSLAVAAPLQGAAVLLAAFAAAAVLVLPDGRRRAWAMVLALAGSAAVIGTLVGGQVGDIVGRQPALAGAGAAAGLGAVAVTAGLILRRPHLVALLALGALPFRVPIPVGDGAANLLVPLYVVVAGGCLAYLLRVLREGAGDEDGGYDDRSRALVGLERALAGVLVLYAVQATYSTELSQAAKNVAFFYVPFAVLFRLAADVEWTDQMLRRALGIVAGLAVVFAGIAYYEFATGHLLIPNPKVLAANEAKPYFRVNSLFFDPNIYGRFVALAMIVVATVLLWTRRGRTTVVLAAVLAVLWGGLLLSLSQSSFATLLIGLAVLAALRWRPLPVVAAGVAVAVAGAALVFAFPGTFGVDKTSEQALNRATAGRVKLTRAGLEMARDRPVWGFGSGSFAERYRARERVFSPLAAAESHTIPLTVAAEQGALGLVAYLLLLGSALRLVFSGVAARVRASATPRAVAGVAVAAAFCGLLVHTFGYAAFLEDPLTWALLAVAAALGRTRDVPTPDTIG